MTKRKSRRRFILVSLVLMIGILLSVARFNIPFTDYTYNGFIRSIPLGFDLQGGVSVVFEATQPEDNPSGNLELSIQGTISRIQLLLENEGYTENYVYKQSGNRIVVEVSNLTDTEFLFNKLNEPASFKITTEEDKDAEGSLSEDDIENAGYSAQKGDDGLIQHGVAIIFNDEGKQKFADLTSSLAESGGTMYIYIGDEDEPISRLTASGAVTNGTVFISGENMTEESAKEMALKILSGSFEAKLTLVENNIVSASLGASALKYGVIAILISFFITLVMLVVFYREYGLLSVFSSLFWAVIFLFLLQSVPFSTLNLSSFAGIILSILINFVAYVIIYENIKKENNKGKKLHLSINTGIKNSVGTVVDFHVIMLIASIVLLIIGTSTIKGFAVASFLGVAVSLFTSLVLFKWSIKTYLPLNSNDVSKFNFEKVEVKYNEDK